MAVAVRHYRRGHARPPDDGEFDKLRNRSSDRPAWPDAQASCGYAALGIRARVQHTLSDRPLHAWQTSEGRAVEPTCSARGVFFRLAARGKDCGDDESGIIVRGSKLAIGGRSNCAAQ